MPKQELQPNHHKIHEKPRGDELIAKFAAGHVRQYDSYDPRLVIDIIEDGNTLGKIIANRYTGFEFADTNLDRVELVRGHHKARLIFAIGNSIPDETGGIKHEVYSPDGLVGFARGDNLDFYIASLLHEDEKIKQKALEGEGGFDIDVQRYLEEEFGLPGLFGN